MLSRSSVSLRPGRLGWECGIVSQTGVSESEFLQLVLDMGYYEQPRRCRIQDVADRLGLHKGSVHERLVRLENRAVRQYAERIVSASGVVL